MNDRGWTRNETDLWRIRFLDWVAESTTSSRIPAAINFLGDPATVEPEEEQRLIEMVKMLVAEGLIGGEKSLAGWSTYHAMLTDHGRNVVQKRRDQRGNHVARAVASREALLEWLYVSKSKDQHPHIGLFHGDPRSHFEGDPFTEAEANDASLHLREYGMIRGDKSWGSGVTRPEITPKGQQVVENNVPPANWTDGGASGSVVTNNFNGNFSAPVAAGHTVNQTIGVDPVQFARLVGNLQGALSSLSDVEQARGAALIEMIEAEAASPRPDSGIARAALRGLTNLADKVTSAAVGASVAMLWTYLADRWNFPID